MSEVWGRAAFRRVCHAVFVVMHLVLAVGTAGAFGLYARRAAADAATERSPNARIYTCEAGEWGRVSWHYIHIEAPD